MDEAEVEDRDLDEPRLDGAGLEHAGDQGEDLFGEPVSASASAAPLALYRRYRPDTFADVIGQEHVTEPLQRALTNNRVNHAYLFSGPRGCGKTTSARILARALNCEFGPRAEPCGHCQSCQDLARGGSGSIDVIEIDAASHGGVDDARDLRERAFFSPVASRYKIYIIDEAHMVTTAGFNALLKLVEEPPPHVKFIFATTEPDKVIGTIRSRTHHYPFRLVPPRVLTDYLAKLCAAEGITVEPAVLPLVVRAGAGSVRDSLSVLDQLLGGADESGVAYRQAATLLGYTPDSLLDEFVDAFAAGDAGGVFSCVDKVIEVGQDPRRFAEDLLRRLRDLVIVAAVPDALSSGLVDVAADQAERLSSQAASLGAGELTRAAEVIAAGLTDMRGTTAPRLHLELMCARVLLPGADIDNRGVHARLDRLERRLGVVGTTTELRRPSPINTAPLEPAPAGRASAGRASAERTSAERAFAEDAPGASASAVPAEPAATEVAPTEVGATGTASGEVESVPHARPAEDRAPAASPSSPQPAREGVGPPIRRPGPEAPVPKSGDARGSAGGESDDTALGPQRTGAPAGPGKDPGQAGLTVTDVRRLWPEVLEEVKGKRRFTWILLSQNAHVAEVRNGTLLLAMANAGARDSFGRGGSEDVLREAIVVVLGADFAIQTMVDPSVAGAPSAGVSPAGVSPVSTGGQGRVRPAEPSPPPAPVPPAASPVSPPPSAESVPESAAPADLTARRMARENIRPTRKAAARDQEADDRDAVARRDDSDVDETSESHTELLARALGAEVIAEEEDGA